MNKYLIHSIQALRHKNFVYVRNLKCASTFFYSNLLDIGWESIGMEDIDPLDTVFSHIMDPIKRRHQGVAEYIHMCGLSEQFLSDDRMWKLLKYTPTLDRHSLPYCYSFGDYFKKINWIPLSGTNEDNIRRTEEWLNYRGLNVDLYSRRDQFVHSSDEIKKKVVAKLADLWKDANYFYSNRCREFQQEWVTHYNNCRGPDWPDPPHYSNFSQLPELVRKELSAKFLMKYSTVTDDLMSIIDSKLESIMSPQLILTNTVTQFELEILAPDIKLWQETLKKFNLT